GLPVLFCLFLFVLSSGSWSGYVRDIDYHYVSIGNLVPHSDPAGYFWDTLHLAYRGDWEVMGSRRPMAQAFRQVTTFAVNYSYVGTLIVQLALMASMLYVTAAAIARWRGIWI